MSQMKKNSFTTSSSEESMLTEEDLESVSGGVSTSGSDSVTPTMGGIVGGLVSAKVLGANEGLRTYREGGAARVVARKAGLGIVKGGLAGAATGAGGAYIEGQIAGRSHSS